MAIQAMQRRLSLLWGFLLTSLLSLSIHAQQSPGNAAQLNGSDYIRTTLWSHDIFNTESFSFELWFNAATPGVLIGEPDTANVSLWDVAFAELLQNGSVVVGVPGVPSFNAGTVPFNSWQHLVVTYNHQTSVLAAFLNGQPAGSSSGSRTSPADIGRTSVYCFGRGGPRNLGPGGFLNGKFDEIRIWRIALTAAEVAGSWNRIRTTDAAGLMALWHLDARQANNQALSPDSRTAANNPAWYVPDTQAFNLVPSTIPVVGAVPTVVTQTPTFSNGIATLRGVANPQGVPMSVRFEWGQTTAYGNFTPGQDIGAGTTDVNFTATLNSLTPGEYHYRAIATSGTATFTGADQVLSIPAPTVTTLAATRTGNSVQLRGSSNPRGYSTSVHFEWGQTTAYGNTTSPLDIGSGTSEITFTAALEQLAPGQYHYRAVAVTPFGSIRGSNMTVTIPSPTVATLTAIVTDRNAELRGVANPQGVSTSVHFEWGPTTFYGNVTPSQDIGTGGADVNFAATLASIAPGEYHYRAVAVSSLGTIRGADQVFTIQGPSVTTGPAVVDDRAVELRGTANSLVFPMNVRFEWGATTSYGSSTPNQAIPAGGSPVNFSAMLNNLSAGTYHYRAVGTFEDRTVVGADATFAIAPPTAQTLAPIVTQNSAELRASIDPNGFEASAYFEWGSLTDFANSTPARPISAGANVTLSETISNLAPGSYRYRPVVVLGEQTIRGDIVPFTIYGLAGNAARLSGAEYLRTTTWSHQIFDDEDFTIELWFKPASPGVLINEADTANTALWDYAFAELLPGGVIRAGVPGVPAFTVGTIQFNTWHHIALVYDDAANLLSAYLDGQPAGTSAGDRQTPAEIQRTSIYCFGRGGMGNLGPGNFLSGLIDEVRIWRRPIPAAQIAALYNKVIPNTDVGLMGNWHLDQIGNPTYTSPDASGTGNHAWFVPQNTAIPLQFSDAPVSPDQRPLATSLAVEALAPGLARARGTVDARGVATEYYFEYGQDGVFQRTPTRTIPAGNTVVTVEETIPVRIGAPSYEIRLVASNTFGSAISAPATFSPRNWAGNAIRFTSDYLRTQTAVPASLFPTKSITIEVWFFPTKHGVIVGENPGTASSTERSLIEILASGSVEARIYDLIPVTLGTAAFNRWNHVAIRYDESTQTMHGFLNGVRSAARTGVRPAVSNIYYTFGRATPNNRIGTGESFGGDMDEIRVWNVARADQEIVSYKNLLVGREAELIFYWRLDSLSGGILEDSGLRGITGTASGGELVPSTAPLSFGLRIAANLVEAHFFGEPNTPALLQSTSNFVDWTTEAELTVPASGVVRVPLTIGPGTKLFRLIPRPAPAP